MRMLMRSFVMCVVVGWAGLALAAPKVDPREQLKRATQLDESGEYQKALEAIEQGLPAAPKDVKLKLLGLKGTLQIKVRDYGGAIATYEAYLAAGATAGNRREVMKMLDNLRAVKSTTLEITLANGPGDVYLDSKTQGVFCTAAPSCSQAVLPGAYKVIVERPGFEHSITDASVESGKATKVAVTLVEEPSLLTVRAEPARARVAIDGTPLDGPAKIAPGKHRLVVTLEGHAEERRDLEAHEGKPIELDIALAPLVPIRVEPSDAEVRIDGKPAAIELGRVAVPRGAHVLSARAAGFRDREIDIPADRGADYSLVVALERAPVAEDAEASPSRGTFTGQRKLALGVLAVGVGAAATGVVLGIQASNIEDDGTLDAKHRRQSRTLQSELAYGVGGVAAAIAIGLWLDGAPGPRSSRVAIVPRLDTVAGVDVAVRF